MPAHPTNRTPLHVVVGTVAAFWATANIGYYYLLPTLGYSLDYNLASLPIALYFGVWCIVSILYFWRLFGSQVHLDYRIWKYGALSLVFAAGISALIYFLSLFPSVRGPLLSPYTDLLFATPWYFVPKAIEVLFQQLLIATLILEFYDRFRSFNQVLTNYALTFVGSHVALFALGSAPGVYAASITLWAAASTWVFPYLILRVRGGFVYAYAIHLVSYIFLAMILHAWPPPGYFGV